MKIFQKINDWIEKIFGVIITLFLAAMVIIVSIQVFYRYCLNTGLIWSEELARFTNIWLVVMASAIAIYRRSHIRVSMLEETVTQVRWLLNLLQDIIVFLFSCAITYYGVKYLNMAGKSTSVGIQINMKWIFLAFPISGCAMILASLYNVIDRILEKVHPNREEASE